MIKLVIKNQFASKIGYNTIADGILYKHSSHKKHILSGNRSWSYQL